MSGHASGKYGAIATAGMKPVEAALDILADEGNAIDAAVSAILVLSITDHGMYTFGGEIPFMVHHAATGKTLVLSAVGKAPHDSETIEQYMRNGIPDQGDVRAAPIPSTVDLCVKALSLFGTINFRRAAEPMMRELAENRKAFHPALLGLMERLIEAESTAGGTREQRLAAVSDRFYRGDIADRLAAWYHEAGSFLRKSDLARHETRLENPVAAAYRGWTVYKCGPWTQGPVLLQTLRLLEGFDLSALGHLQADSVHLAVEAMKLAYADRDTFYADPLFADVPIDRLLSDEYTEIRRTLLDPMRASSEFRPGDPFRMKPRLSGSAGPVKWEPGTTTCVTADRHGNVVAATPSCNPPYHLCPELGIPHGNRLRCLNTDPTHPNRIEPGKRPRITLTPTLAAKNGRVRIAISVAGGDMQDQATLNLLLNHVDFGMKPDQAASSPRFGTEHHEDSFRSLSDRSSTRVGPNTLVLDQRIDSTLGDALEARGHCVKRSEKPLARPVMLVIDPASGEIAAAGDPLVGHCAGAI